MNVAYYSRARKTFFSWLMILIMILTMGLPANVSYAGVNDITAYGLNINNSYAPSWSPGNLGKTYEEGEWAAFQTIVKNVDWATFVNLGVEFDFYELNKNARFYDLIRNVSIADASFFAGGQLPNDHGFPMENGDPFPLGTEANTNLAQRDPNINQEHYFEEMEPIVFSEAEFMAQVNRPVYDDPLHPDGLETDQTRIMYITKEQIADAFEANPGRYPGFDRTDDSTYPNDIVMYFQLHLARTFIWNNQGDYDHDGILDASLALTYSYDIPPTSPYPWGGYVYTEDFLQSLMLGSAGFSGSSGHSYVFINDGDSGEKTLPIPDVAETTGTISGYKYEDVDGDGLYDEGLDIPIEGWDIFLRTDLFAIENIEFPTTTDANGYYEFNNLPYYLLWEVSEESQEYYVQTHPNDTTPYEGIDPQTGDPEQDWYKEPFMLEDLGDYEGLVREPWGWFVKLAPPDHLYQGNVNFLNMFADPSVAIVKTGDELSKIGDDVTYTFEVTNTGNVDIDLVSIFDDQIGEINLGNIISGDIRPVLPPGETDTFSIGFTIPEGASDPFINIVTANYEYYGIPVLDLDELTPQDSHSTNLFQPSFTVEKTGDELSKIGDSVDYVITVDNTSSEDTPDMEFTIVDPLVGVNELVTLASGEEHVISIPGFIIPDDAPDPFINTVEVTGSPIGFPNTYVIEDVWETNLFQPAISVTKTGHELSKIGDPVDYEIIVYNESSADTPDMEFTIVDVMLGVNEVVVLSSGQTHTINVDGFEIPEGADDPFVNVVNVTASPIGFPNVYEASASWSTNLFQPGVMIEKTGDAISKIGDYANYTVTVTNIGSADSPPIYGDVDDSLVGPIGSFENLAVGDSVSFSYSYLVPEGAPDPLVNTASVLAHPFGFPNDLVDSASWTTELFQPEISVTKTGNRLSKVGDPVDYVITVYNNSSSDTPDMEFVIEDTMIGLYEEVTLASGETHIINWNGFIIPAGAPDPFTNTVEVWASPIGFPNEYTAEASWTTELFQPGVMIEKTGEEFSKAGDTTHYVVTVTNVGSLDSPPISGAVDDSLVGPLGSFESLPVNESITFEYDYLIPEGATDPLVNTASVLAHPDGFPNDLTDEDTWITELFQPAIAVTKTGTPLSKIGDPVDFVITVYNNSSPDTPDMEFVIDDPTIGYYEEVTLASGAVYVINIEDFIIPEGAPDPFENTVHVWASPIGFPNEYTAEASWEINLFQPGVSLVKEGDAISKVGDYANYTVTVTNVGSADSPPIYGDVDDSLVGPIGSFENLAVGDSVIFSYSYLVPEGAPDPLVNTASVLAHPDGFPNDLTDEDTWITELFQPAIAVTKTGTPLSKVGDPVDFVITVYNNSSPDTPDMEFVIDDPTIGYYEEVTLASGAVYVINIEDFIIPEGAPDPFENTVHVWASPIGFPNEYTAEASWEINLFQPGVSLVKEGEEFSKAGDTTHYVVTVTNVGSPDSPPIFGDVNDSLVGYLGSFSGLAVGDSVTFEYDYLIPEGATDPLVNTASVLAHPEGFLNDLTAEDTWITELFQPAIAVTKTGDGLSKIGDPVDYVITVYNNSSPDTPDMEFVIDDPTIGYYEEVTLASGAVYVINIDDFIIPEDAPDPFVNTVYVWASPIGFPNEYEAQATWETNLFQPSVVISKTGNEFSKVGDEVIYTITVENTSSPDSPNLVGTLEDPMLGLSLPLDMAPGDSIIVEIPYIVPEGAPDPMINTATVTLSPFEFPNIITASASHEVDLVHPSIEIIKDVDPSTVMAGDTVTYTVTITNTGDWPLENIVVTDDIHQALLPMFPTELAVGESYTATYDYVAQMTDPSPLIDTATVHANPYGLPNDIWDDDPAELTIVKYNDETAWAKYYMDYPEEPGAIPFENGVLNLKNWGWTNGPFIIPFEEFEMTLYASQTIDVGEVIVTMDAENIYVEYIVDGDVIITDLHLYIGEGMLPMKNGKYINSPGQFPYGAGDLMTDSYMFTISWEELELEEGDEFFIAAHAVVLVPTDY